MLEIAVIAASIAGIIYIYLIWNYKYWKNRNIPYIKPQIFFGNIADNFFLRKAISEVYQVIYNQFPGLPYGGFFRMRNPALILRDPEFIKNVLVKDFQNFHDNDFKMDEKADPMLGKNPFVLTGDKWKVVRSQLTPPFSKGKVKNIFNLIKEISDRLVIYMNENFPDLSTNEGTEVVELASKYTTDVIASVAFGLEGESFTNPDAQFRRMGKKILEPTFWVQIQLLGIIFMPRLANLLGFRFIPKVVANWFQGVVTETISYREENKTSRNDFLQLLMELKEKSTEYEFTNEHVTAHAVVFFTDGFESSAILITTALYELAENLKVQQIVHQEIDSVLQKYNGTITYDGLQEMKYLDRVIMETLRKYPSVPFMNRLCTSPYEFPNPNGGNPLQIEPGTSVIIPIYALHWDPINFPNPDEFDPDRFTEEQISKRHKFVYLPFGEGPRICLGSNLALLQIKTGLTAILHSFSVRKSTKTIKPTPAPGNIFLSPKEGVFLKFKKRFEIFTEL